MANSSIYEKIENKGIADAKEINRIGQEKARQIEESILNAAKSDIDMQIAKAKMRANELLKTKTTEIEQNAKQKSLLKKKELLNNTFKKAVDKLNELNDEEFVQLVKKLVELEKINGNEVLKVSKKDFPRYLKLFSSEKMINGNYVLDKLNNMFDHKDYHLVLSQDFVNINGGFILVGEAYDIDHSFETIMNVLQEKYETIVASLLFAQGE